MKIIRMSQKLSSKLLNKIKITYHQAKFEKILKNMIFKLIIKRCHLKKLPRKNKSHREKK